MDALFARAARLVKVDYVEPPTRDRQDDGDRAPVRPRLRLRGPGGRHRRARSAASSAPTRPRRNRRPRRPDRAAREDDLAGRPVPDARRAAHRLGAQPPATRSGWVSRRRRSRSAAPRAGARLLRHARLELVEQLRGAGRGREQPRHDLLGRRELHELLLERLREAAVAEVPAVELLQEAGRAALAELAHRLADEEDQLGGDLLARRLARRRRRRSRGAPTGCPARRGRPSPPPHRSRRAPPPPARASHVARRDDRHVDELDELGGQRVVGVARVHLLRRARVERQRRGAGLDEPRPELEARCASRSRGRAASSRSPARRPRSRPPRRSGTRARVVRAGARRRRSSSPCGRGSRS